MFKYINPKLVWNNETSKPMLVHFYLCNRKKCFKCRKECRYTTDQRYAVREIIKKNNPPVKNKRTKVRPKTDEMHIYLH